MPLQIFPDYRSVRDKFCRGEERGWGSYEGMIVVVALLSQEDVEGHQSPVIARKIGAWASSRME